jgi:hypothetical protein
MKNFSKSDFNLVKHGNLFSTFKPLNLLVLSNNSSEVPPKHVDPDLPLAESNLLSNPLSHDPVLNKR